jgi:hypothetical protein
MTIVFLGAVKAPSGFLHMWEKKERGRVPPAPFKIKALKGLFR